MRYSAEHKQETRNRIVRAAARQFCRPEGKGSAIADLMRELGLTHGGFYKHFDSKQQLLAEAITWKQRECNCRVLMSGMVGALNLARAAVDQKSREAILDAAKEFYIMAFCK